MTYIHRGRDILASAESRNLNNQKGQNHEEEQPKSTRSLKRLANGEELSDKGLERKRKVDWERSDEYSSNVPI